VNLGVKHAACMLVVKRIKGQIRYLAVHSPHKRPGWGLPGGKVGSKETFERAAVRECYEETGIQAIVHLDCYHRSQPLYTGRDSIDGKYIVKTYLAHWANGSLRSSSEGKAAWVTKKQLLDGPYGEYNKLVFEHLALHERLFGSAVAKRF
jgi:8-oxo-dGTP pyrophosphatase MutT (NUDIX family)